MLKVSVETFESEVLQSPVPVVVDFFAPWCGPCRMLGPVLDRLAGDYQERLKFAQVNVDEDPELANSFGVQSVPTLLFVKDGEVVDFTVGLADQASLVRRLNQLIGTQTAKV